MARFGNTAMLEGAERVAYHRSLYQRSERERLRRINYTRAREGRPLAASLAECKLRVPLSKDEQDLGIRGFGSDGAPF